jgi:iron-sulfur cluster assembly protein
MVTLTELAASKVQTNLDRRGQGVGIRIGVKTTGCSGLAYVLEFVDLPKEEDLKFISNGVNVFVDPKSLVYVNGITMDWQKKGLNEGFEFINPQEKDRCGCGESFRI